MTTNADAYQAGIDAVVADNTLNKAGFAGAIRTVVTDQYTDADAKEWTDAIVALYDHLAIISVETWAKLRTHIIKDPVGARNLFDAMAMGIGELPETHKINRALRLLDLRAERDEVNISIDSMTGFKPGATRQVKDALNLGIDQLRGHKESVRDQIRVITGDPDYNPEED
jgi:hypothetical protein